MKYLKYLPDAASINDIAKDLLYDWRRPSIAYAPKINNIDLSQFSQFGLSTSSNVIYKNGAMNFLTVDYRNQPYNAFQLTINNNTFNDDDENGAHKISGTFDKLAIESVQYKSGLTDYVGLVPLYNLQDFMTGMGQGNLYIYPQCFYDYLEENNMTKTEFENILKGSDSTAITNLRNTCLEKGFYPKYGQILYCYVRGDMEQIYPEVNDGNAYGVWLLWQDNSYNPSTKEVIGIE